MGQLGGSFSLSIKMLKFLKLEILHLQTFNPDLLNTNCPPGIMLSVDPEWQVLQHSYCLHRADATVREVLVAL